MLSEMGVRTMIAGGGEGFTGEDLGLMLREQRNDRERELSIYRSGSAPPTVEGSLTAIGGLFTGDSGRGPGISEEDVLSDPAYVSYYYSNVNLNPRLPPPVFSKEDWRSQRRIQTGSSGHGGIGDKRNSGRIEEGWNSSLFSMQPGFGAKVDDEDDKPLQGSGEWLEKGGDGLIGLPGLSLGRQKSFADLFQDDQMQRTTISGHLSRPASRNTFDDSVEPIRSGELYILDANRPGNNAQRAVTSVVPTFASVVGSSLSRSTTPDPQLVARAPSPRLPPVGVKIGNNDKKSSNNLSSLDRPPLILAESDDLISALSIMNMSNSATFEESMQPTLLNDGVDNTNYLFDLHGGQPSIKPPAFRHYSEQLNPSAVHQPANGSFHGISRNSSGFNDFNNAISRPTQHAEVPKLSRSSNNAHFLKGASTSIRSPGGSPVRYSRNSDGSNSSFTNYGVNGYSINSLPSMMPSPVGTGNLPPLFESAAAASVLGSQTMDPSMVLGGGFSSSNLCGSADLQNLGKIGNHSMASTLQMPLLDPLYVQYLSAANNFNDISSDRGFTGNSYADSFGIPKAYLGALIQQQKQFGMPFLGKSGYYGGPTFGLGMPYQGSPLASPVLPASPVGSGSPLRHAERNLHFSSGMRNMMGAWHMDGGGNMHDGFASSLLEEFKNNKTKCYELSDIAGHVVEFSADQYGSRFIQQKLETATVKEKDMVFDEIMPHAFSLMTDVFGNYVVQKFFEHGSHAQRSELADQLTGHVLTLSLQMYGCRVIQKAIEVVDSDQQTKMVKELDGHVMRCVRDQNGNHVIQKCIECISQDAIQFIVSTFYDQVVTLSTHPYGCRVIQRVLEHCDDLKTQQIMMDEILDSVCMLAQDQYGNYVVQHVLEHGKPQERSAIIQKLAGQIVQMSQQKFASNVVEKCLTFGGAEERQFLVNEMLGLTDENEPLQAMMKDQFANYVVQKVLETCDDQQRELILSRIKVHLNALKKYTYGKHIVARVEKLVAAGVSLMNAERRIGGAQQASSYNNN